MSASLVRKSLSVVDPQVETNITKKRRKKNDVFTLAPDNHKLITRGKKGHKVNLLSTERKLTVSEARRKHKTKGQVLKENLQKLETIRATSKVDLDEKIINQIIERAVTKRPLMKSKEKVKKQQTAFTEEDFKKFEEEYMAE